MEITTIEEAKKILRESFDDGVECPCCGQFVKRYRRKLNSSMAAMLVAVWKNAGKEFVHVNKLIVKLPRLHSNVGGGDFAKLVHWKLIEAQAGTRSDGCKHNGYFRVTQRGEDFINQKCLVSSHIQIYNQKFQGYSGEGITILEALGSKFNYNELMAGI